MKRGAKIGIGIVVFVLVVMWIAGSMIPNQELEQRSRIPDMASMSNSELQSLSTDWTYELLLRNADFYDRKIIHVTGIVTIPTKNGIFGIDVGDSGILRFSDDDIIFVEYDTERFFEDDQVELFGYVNGERNLLITSPLSDAEKTELVPNIEPIKVICSTC